MEELRPERRMGELRGRRAEREEDEERSKQGHTAAREFSMTTVGQQDLRTALATRTEDGPPTQGRPARYTAEERAGAGPAAQRTRRLYTEPEMVGMRARMMGQGSVATEAKEEEGKERGQGSAEARPFTDSLSEVAGKAIHQLNDRELFDRIRRLTALATNLPRLDGDKVSASQYFRALEARSKNDEDRRDTILLVKGTLGKWAAEAIADGAEDDRATYSKVKRLLHKAAPDPPGGLTSTSWYKMIRKPDVSIRTHWRQGVAYAITIDADNDVTPGGSKTHQHVDAVWHWFRTTCALPNVGEAAWLEWKAMLDRRPNRASNGLPDEIAAAIEREQKASRSAKDIVDRVIASMATREEAEETGETDREMHTETFEYDARGQEWKQETGDDTGQD